MGVEETYPKLPSSPTEEANFNAGIINGYYNELKTTKRKLQVKYKKHCRRSSMACNYVSGAECISTFICAWALASVPTVIALPVSLVFGSLSTAIGLSILPTSKFIKTCQKKITLIDKLNSSIVIIETLISQDGNGNDEFKKIRDEYIRITREISKVNIKSKNDQMRLILRRMDGLEQKVYSSA